MSSRFWTPIAIVLILFSFIAFAFLARKPICIDSRVVEKIDRIDELKGSAMAYRCSLHRAVPYDEELDNSMIALGRRIQPMEKFLESLAPYEQSLHLTIYENKTGYFRQFGRETFISRDLVSENGILEKSLIKSWLAEKGNLQVLDHPVLVESLSDLLYFAASGDFDLVEPRTQNPLDLSVPEKWPFVVKSLLGYCRSPWREYEHLPLCEREPGQLDPQEKNLIPMSLRPLLTQAMIAAYMRLKPAERKTFLESLPQVLSSFSSSPGGVGYSSIDLERQNLVDLSVEMSSLLQSLEMAGRTGAYRKWHGVFISEIEKRGFSGESGVARLDHLLVLSGNHVDLEMPDITRSLKKYNSVITAIVEDDQIYLLPTAEALSKRMFDKIYAGRVTMIACGAPTLAEIDAYSDLSSRLTLIHHCRDGENSVLNLDGVFTGDMEKFALQNPEISFVEIHLPSLHYAMKLRKLSPQLKLTSNLDNPQILQSVGWTTPRYDNKLKAYRPQSAIEAFQLFRPLRALNN